MRRCVLVLLLFSVVLGALCLYVVYSVVDQSVALDHARAAQRSLEEDRAVLRKLTLDLAKVAKRDEVEVVLATKYAQGHIVKREADTIFVDGVGLRFREANLSASCS